MAQYFGMDKKKMKRKDTLKLKEQLFALIPDEQSRIEYNNTLCSYLHNQCSRAIFEEKMKKCLPNNAAKKLHNRFITAIIYNAHFSIIPPPNVELPPYHPSIPAPQKIPDVDKTRNGKFFSYTAIDMLHLPTSSQLRERFSILLLNGNNRHLKFDDKTINFAHQKLNDIIRNILEESLKLLGTDYSQNSHRVLCLNQILRVIQNNPAYFQFASPSVLAKYSS